MKCIIVIVPAKREGAALSLPFLSNSILITHTAHRNRVTVMERNYALDRTSLTLYHPLQHYGAFGKVSGTGGVVGAISLP